MSLNEHEISISIARSLSIEPPKERLRDQNLSVDEFVAAKALLTIPIQYGSIRGSKAFNSNQLWST